jgi:hypothetical protein
MLALIGLGETWPTMVSGDREALDRRAGTSIRILDTPYGFQENCDDITRRAQQYLRRSLGAASTPT